MVTPVLRAQPAKLGLAVKLAQPVLVVQLVQMVLKVDRAPQDLAVTLDLVVTLGLRVQLGKLGLAVRREHVVLLETRAQPVKWAQLVPQVPRVRQE